MHLKLITIKRLQAVSEPAGAKSGASAVATSIYITEEVLTSLNQNGKLYVENPNGQRIRLTFEKTANDMLQEERNVGKRMEPLPGLMNISGEEDRLTATVPENKDDISPYDIFRLAKGILISATGIYIGLICIRIFCSGTNTEAIKEVWEYFKVFLNSIIPLVLGLYFGSSQRKQPLKS